MSANAIIEKFISLYGICDFAEIASHLLPCRAISRVPKNAKSVIVCLFPYRFANEGERELSRYACVEDYHLAAGAVLERMADALHDAFPAFTFAPFTDNSPIPEVYTAALAGLGMIGDHSLLIHPDFGSYVFIGEIVTDMPLPSTHTPITHCEHCGACATACHGNCLPSSDRTHCVSAVSQKKGTLTDEETALLRQNGLVWGCDTCQEVCPHNRDARIQPHPCFSDYLPTLLDADDPRFSSRAYGWRGAAVPARNKELLKK